MAGSKWWPDVDTLETAKSASRQGVWAALFVAVLTCVVAGISMATGQAIMGIDAWAFVDAGLFAVLAFGIYKMSRFAAAAGLGLYVLERVYMLTVNASARGLIVAVFIILAFCNSIRGTFAFRKLSNVPVPGQAPPPLAP